MRYYVVALLLIISSCLYSQESDINFSNLSINDGLAQSAVYAILQDSEGFMWFGTTEGINRYDGSEFVHYKHELGDSCSLAENFVVSIIEGSDNNIWVATRDGSINIFNKRTKIFKQLKLPHIYYNAPNTTSILLIYEDSKNDIWIGTSNGLYKYNLKTKTFNIDVNNSLITNLLSNHTISAIYEDKNTDLWVGTASGKLYKILNQTKETIKILPCEDNKYLNLDHISSILEDKINHERLWFVANKGLFTMDLTNNDIKKIDLETNKEIILNRGIIDNLNNIWIGSKNSGMIKFNILNNSIANFKHNPNKESSISNNSILSFYIDKSDLLWFGTRGGGVNKLLDDNFHHLSHIPNNNNSLINNSIWTIYEDSLNFLWIGTENGLDRINKSTGEFTHYQHDPTNLNSLSENNIFAFCEDQFNNIWVGTTHRGLNLFNRETNTFSRFLNQPEDLKSINSNAIKYIFNDSFGNLWIGTRGGGLNKFNYKDKTFTHFTHDEDDKTSIASNMVNTIYETSDGTLWIGTANGLEKFNRENQTFTHYSYNAKNSNSINDIHIFSLIEGPNNNLWIGTFNGGLNKFDYRTEEFTHFTIEDGLENNVIYSLELDNDNNLWLSSNGALTKFSILNHSITNYRKENGLRNLEFNLNASFKNPEGILYFGGMNGLDYFNPEKFSPETKYTSFHFTDLIVNKSLHSADNILITKQITYESEIKLNYNEYPFSLYFSLLDYRYPKNNLYKYKIEELSENWIDIGNENKLTFTKLSPGNYTLEILAINSFSQVSKTRSIKIIIVPPFWKELWFIIIEIFVFILLIVAYILYRERKIKRDKKLLAIKVKSRTKELENQKEELKTQIEFNQQQQEKIKIQNLELEQHKSNLEGLVEIRTIDLEKAKNKAVESDRLKSSFLANISHEIRTPMNAIVGFSELLKQTGNPSTKQIDMLNLIHFNSNSLLNLINDIVDIAKLETGEIILNKTSFDINKLLKDLYESYSKNKTLQIKEIELKLVKFKEPILLTSDENKIKQIFSKLLENAIKYTETGVIEFGYNIEKENKQIQFYVKDTGIGLSDIQKDEIFKLFRKIETDKNKLYRGVGLGLTFCNRLVQLINGEIWVESKEEVGSTFHFTIPIETPSHIEPEHKRAIPKYNWENKNILIAEDEINNYKFLDAVLKPTKVNTYYAQNGAEAVDITKNENIDLIIMDVKMPVMDGLEATKIIRETNKEVKIIAFTAYAMTNDEAVVIDYGCDDYISKPAKPNQIMKIINNYLN